jgi:Tfp pilus assembly protein PilW
MIGASLGSIVLLGVMTTFLMLGRSGARLSNYQDMEMQSRRTLEEFAQDVRMASAITTNSASSVTLTVTDNYASNGNQVTYAYGTVTIGGTTYTNAFYRRPGNTSSTAAATLLMRNVTTCTFNRYDRLGASTTSDSSTKRIELSLKSSITSATTATATENAIGSTYVMRNKLAN